MKQLMRLVSLLSLALSMHAGLAGDSSSGACGLNVRIEAAPDLLAASCCRCESQGRPCRCGRVAGRTGCNCDSDPCTTGVNPDTLTLSAPVVIPASAGRSATLHLSGRLIDEVSGTPLAGSQVLVVGAHGEHYSTATDSSGSFAVLMAVPISGASGSLRQDLGDLPYASGEAPYFIRVVRRPRPPSL